jgi:uncharacterized membrane protein YbhN (UPF0104 family)
LHELGGSLKKTVLHRKSKILFFAKLGVSLGLVAYLGWIGDWERAVKTIGEADKSLLLIAPLLLLARLGAAALRWRLILADSQVTFPLRQAYMDYLVGTVYNVLLPGVTGGDAIRIGRCVRQTRCQLGTATASVLLERISGVFALLSIAFSAYLLFPSTLPSLLSTEKISPVTMVAIAGITLTAAMILERRAWLRWLPRGGARGAWRFVRSAMQTLSILRWRTLGAVFILSILFQAVDIVATFLLSQALGLTVPITVFFATIPLVYLAIFLPISLGGLGVREGTFVFLLAQFGVAAPDAVTLSFLVYLNRIAIGGLGGLAQLAEAVFSKEASRATEDANIVGIPNQGWSL